MPTVKELQPSMNDLLQHVANDTQLKIGEMLSGKVISISKNEVLIDIENVGLGIVRGKEIYNEEYISRIKEGNTVEGIILDLDNELGMIELSFRAIGRDKIWNEIKAQYEKQETVDARIREVNKGGYIVKVQGVDGFLPASLLSPTHAIKQVGLEDKSLVNQMKKYLGQVFKVKIISINPEADTVIVSEKLVSDEIASEKLSKYKVGQVVEGTIVGTVDFGVFVRFDDELEGLVHISELAWKKVEDPRKEYKIGEKIQAKILEIDKESRINLSIKQLLPNPWNQFIKGAKIQDKFVGTVAKIVSYGAIVVNKEDIQGLIHISQITDKTIDSPAQIYDYLKVGETKEFTILSIDEDEKLYLTLLDFELANQRKDLIAKTKEELETVETQSEIEEKSEETQN
jgi:ribosomal protein S1